MKLLAIPTERTIWEACNCTAIEAAFYHDCFDIYAALFYDYFLFVVDGDTISTQKAFIKGLSVDFSKWHPWAMNELIDMIYPSII